MKRFKTKAIGILSGVFLLALLIPTNTFAQSTNFNFNKEQIKLIIDLMEILDINDEAKSIINKLLFPDTYSNDTDSSENEYDAFEYDQEYIIGESNTLLTLETWVGYSEPFSKKYSKTVSSLLENYSDDLNQYVKYATIPNLFPEDERAIEAMECAIDQNPKYFTALHEIFNVVTGVWDEANSETLQAYIDTNSGLKGLDVDELHDCIESGKYNKRIDKVVTDMEKNSPDKKLINGVPTSFIKNNLTGKIEKRLDGAQPYEVISDFIQDLLAK